MLLETCYWEIQDYMLFNLCKRRCSSFFTANIQDNYKKNLLDVNPNSSQNQSWPTTYYQSDFMSRYSIKR